MTNKAKTTTDTVLVLASVFPIVDAAKGNVIIEKGKTGLLPRDKAEILIKKNLAQYANDTSAGTPEVSALSGE